MVYDTRFAIGPGSDVVPEISVLSANKNHGRFIEENIVSVLAQRGVTYEHIIIEGGSADESLEVIGRYPHLVCKVAPELNVDEAFAEAARMARGKYIMVTTSTDGYLGTNWFRKAVDVMEGDPEVSLVWANTQHMSEDGLLLHVAWPEYFTTPPPQKVDLFFKFIKSDTLTYLPELNYCVRRDVFLECFFSNEADGDIEEMKELHYFLRFLFKFHQRGYLAQYVNVVANFGRTHKGQYTDVVTADGRMQRFDALYAKAVERYRNLLWSGRGHRFRNGRGEVIGYFNWPTLVFDVGANLGEKAAGFLDHGARVVCFEPIPDCVSHLQGRFNGNASVTIAPVALGAAPGTLPLSVCTQAPTISTFSDEWKHGRFKDYTWDQTIEVPVRTLDSAIAQFGVPDYCKIDVEGFESQVVAGLSQPIPVVSFEFAKEAMPNAVACVRRLVALGLHHFNLIYGASSVFRHREWIDADALLAELERHPDPLMWGDVFAASSRALSPRVEALLPSLPMEEEAPRAGATTLDVLKWRGLAYEGVPVRLHLGCGEQRFEGYVNIDYPSENHNVMAVQPDLATDIIALTFPPGSVDEIRLHHVFEHFNRVVALGLLVRWQAWLRPGGQLTIETPDFEGEARAFLTAGGTFAERMSAIRSLEGDQTAAWAYHVGQWWGERLEYTLGQLGFSQVSIARSLSGHQPPLHNVTATAIRGADRTLAEQLSAADGLLWNSTVADAERPTWTQWTQQLRTFLGTGLAPDRSVAHVRLG